MDHVLLKTVSRCDYLQCPLDLAGRRQYLPIGFFPWAAQNTRCPLPVKDTVTDDFCEQQETLGTKVLVSTRDTAGGLLGHRKMIRHAFEYLFARDDNGSCSSGGAMVRNENPVTEALKSFQAHLGGEFRTSFQLVYFTERSGLTTKTEKVLDVNPAMDGKVGKSPESKLILELNPTPYF
ncbi:Methylmalonic Aciduria Type A Protein [Manis pentadactyla]|nr:Methylmalonic Aciduria Type A Protein [Manis pentadactyla]